MCGRRGRQGARAVESWGGECKLGLQNWGPCWWKSGFLLFISKMKPREGLPQISVTVYWRSGIGPRCAAPRPAYLPIKYTSKGKCSRRENGVLPDQELFSLKFICSLKISNLSSFFRSLSVHSSPLSLAYKLCGCFKPDSTKSYRLFPLYIPVVSFNS